MHGINKVQLIGNVGRDPKSKTLENGVKVTTFSFATSEAHRKRTGERKTSTEWHNIVLWRGLAELAEKFIKKGDPLFIEGKLHTRSWRDREGVMRRSTEVVATNVIMLSPRNKRDNIDDRGFNDDVDLDDITEDDELTEEEPHLGDDDSHNEF